MCLAIPMRLVEREGSVGKAELHGVCRDVSLMLCPEAKQGDHVLVHVGYVISRVDEDEANKTLAMIEQMMAEELPR